MKTKNKKGFTLIEMLVVVLIIGILAAIALPQYQLIVGKARYSTLKTVTRNIQDAAQRYYMLYDSYAGLGSTNELIEKLDIEIPTDVECKIWSAVTMDAARCCTRISNNDICFYVYKTTGLPRNCLAYGNDRTSIRDRICKNDTGDSVGSSATNGWSYDY